MSPNVPTVMIVDDEEMVTKTLAAYLALETDFKVLTFQSPMLALERLNQKPVDLIISDFLMPEIDGLQFIARAQQLYPDLPCILLTGYADKENAIKAVNEVRLFQYVEKPWENEHIKLIIRNAVESKSMRETLQLKIRELDQVLLERDKLMQHNEMIKEELLLARSVQESMLPQTLPNSGRIAVYAKYLPALQVGGDFYDIIQLTKSKFAVLIADVTGHGIQAALITVLLKSAFLDLKGQKAVSPGQILSAINELIYKILPKHIYVAALALLLDTETGECRLANGGIPHPILINNRENRIERIAANGLLLGIADSTAFKPGEEVTLNLTNGDRLILYTDGLSETTNENNEHFDDMLVDVVQSIKNNSGQDLLDHLTKEVKNFSSSKHNWDDITILSIGKSPD